MGRWVSKIRLYFLARYDEGDMVMLSLSGMFEVSLVDVNITETIIPNISVIEVLMPAERSVKTTRNLNVIAINSNTAGMLTGLENVSVEARSLLKRFKNIDKRENFNFLLQLLISEPEETSWLK